MAQGVNTIYTPKRSTFNMSDTKIPVKNIYQRINGVMQEVDYIQKSDKKVNNQYRFASHDQVTAALHAPMTKHGIACIPSIVEMKQDGNRTEVKLEVAFVNIDEPSDRVIVHYWGYGIDQSDKGIGKGVSYAFKYALLKTFCLETGDDPDNDANTRYEPPKPVEDLDLTDAAIDLFCKASAAEQADAFKVYLQYIADTKGKTLSKVIGDARKNLNAAKLAFTGWLEKQPKA